MGFINSKNIGWLSPALVVCILSISGCDKLLGRDNELGTTPPRFVGPDEPTDPAISDNMIPASPILFNIEDINGDGIQDVAVVLEDSESEQVTAIVKDISGNLISNVLFIDDCRFLSAVTLPDMNGDLGLELAVFCQSRTTSELFAEVRDPFNGGLIREILFGSNRQLLFTDKLDDMNGDGYPELAALVRESSDDELLFAQIRDPLNGVFINNVYFDNQFEVRDFLPIPDINSSGIPELVLLGETPSGEFQTVILDAQSSVLMNNKNLGSQYTAKQLSIAPIKDGNAIDEIATLREGDPSSVLIYYANDGTETSVVSFSPGFEPQKLLIVADINGNEALELAVFGIDLENGAFKSEVRDALTGDLLNNVTWPPLYIPLDTVALADMNLNGSQELMLLTQSVSDGSLVVLIKDSKTNELLETVDF